MKRLSEGGITSYTREVGLHDNFIFSITEDGFENLWLSSFNGVFKISRNQLNKFAENEIFSVTPAFYDEADGMASRLCSGENLPAVWQTVTGKLYYPTAMGISIFDPNNSAIQTNPPNIIIEDILADNVSVKNQNKDSFSYRYDKLEFHFSAIDFLAPEKLRFKYKLIGKDLDFIELKPKEPRVAEYLNLKPGNYQFVVKTVKNNGVWMEPGQTFEFEIQTPFYKKPLFFSMLILVMLATAGVAKIFQRKKEIKKQKQKYKTSTLDPDRAEKIVPKLIRLMDEKKYF